MVVEPTLIMSGLYVYVFVITMFLGPLKIAKLPPNTKLPTQFPFR